MPSESASWQHWVGLRDFFIERLRGPVKNPTFIIYFIVAILGVGGIGIWSSLSSLDGTIIGASLYTYFLALAAASAFDLVLAEKQRKYIRAITIAIGVVIITLAIRMIAHPIGAFSIGCGIGGYAVATLLWWIANADNPNLSDDTANVTGGDTNKPTSGSTEGFIIS